MVLRQRSITALCAGLGEAYGKTCSGSSPGTDDPQIRDRPRDREAKRGTEFCPCPSKRHRCTPIKSIIILITFPQIFSVDSFITYFQPNRFCRSLFNLCIVRPLSKNQI